MTDFVAVTGWAWLLGLIGLAVAFLIYRYLKKQPAGSEAMIDLGEQIHDGAMAFLRREYTVLAGFVFIVTIRQDEEKQSVPEYLESETEDKICMDFGLLKTEVTNCLSSER